MVEVAELSAEHCFTTIQYDGESVRVRTGSAFAGGHVRARRADTRTGPSVFDVAEERGIHDLVLWTDTAPGNGVSLWSVGPGRVAQSVERVAA